jgi:hypothetical protein
MGSLEGPICPHTVLTDRAHLNVGLQEPEGGGRYPEIGFSEFLFVAASLGE